MGGAGGTGGAGNTGGNAGLDSETRSQFPASIQKLSGIKDSVVVI